MNKCWAKTISPCSDISKEHYISKCLLLDNVKIKGFKWCSNDYKEIGVDSLTAHCLCKTHNNMLSSLDAAAYDMWLLLGEYNRLVGVRKKIRCDYPVTLKIDGTLFEKWCFKTFCNILSINKLWVPDEKLVEIIFGKAPFPEKCGVSLLYNVGDKMEFTEYIKFQEIMHKIYGPAGFIMDFKGLKLFGSWIMREDLFKYVPKQFIESGKDTNIFYHCNKLEYPKLRIKYIFDWTGHYDNSKNKMIRYLRDNNK